ncbi:rhomboid family protein [Roseivirga ehrenbergii]|uniref:Rhomboid family intramembrane serine protease n=1 Tax=Roseivirga ehrenbergii (strain DSM 102268 / JCM 13514 / KCTC 12282 / NCIMB 14502 / KMM 6017) TaxID=279360 RepID=A0A150XU01_ROSEK|nr:rhomboid family intramembrane serine protease [Roseivirga ehrenbergii]KYG82154.1 rhomboid family intramembrane serine protease [Roseivirga ehrenbergii]TCL01979.1 rhomboid family protein [Roseivirga ehrenbergii]
MFGRLTPLVKNLLYINIGIWLVQFLLKMDLGSRFGLYFIASDNFNPVQFITYMFLHDMSSPMHIFGNMFALFIFGPLLEQFLGPKKFIILYMVTGVGAGLFYTGANYLEVSAIRNDVESYLDNPNSEDFNRLIAKHNIYKAEYIYSFIDEYSRNEDSPQLRQESIQYARGLYAFFGDYPMVGASGAIFGILAAFALLFPNTELFLLFLPFPIKAKYLVTVYILYELFAEFQRAQGDNVAHLAHIGGAIIAFFLVTYWKKSRKEFY